MTQYLIRRVLLMVPTIFGVALLVFIVLRLTPGDVAEMLLAETQAGTDPAMEQRIREDLGLTGSIPQQFGRWMVNILQGDFGESYYSGYAVSDDLKERFPVSLQLGIMAMVIAAVVGIPVGTLAALRQDSWLDYLTRGSVIMFLAVPSFWAAILILQYGRQWFDWAPPARYEDLWVNPWQNLYIMITPALLLGLNLAAIQARFARTQMLEVMRQDYVRTARAKGLNRATIVVRHALRNAIIPVITVIGLQLSAVITGTIILETIFSIPGVGRYLVAGATRADYPIVQSVTLLIAVVVILVNFATDVSYAFLDPRVKATYR